MQKSIRLFAVAFSMLLMLNLISCSQTNSHTLADILTQTVPEKGRIPVTVLVKNAFTINTFEKAAEQAFPTLDIIQVGNHSSNMGIAAYEKRLAHDDLTDIVMTWPLDVGKEYWDDRLIDLSAQPFTGRYNTARLDKVSQNGKLYYLPGPSQIRAIVYNKTLFAEKGWTVPNNFDEFVALCEKIEASGIHSLQLGLGNEEVLDTAFVGFSLSDCFSTPADAQWLADYNAGTGSFARHFDLAFNTFQTLIEHKILQPGDLEITYADREFMLFNRECAMVEDSTLLARRGEDFNGSTDEFGLMPFFNPGKSGDWARLYPVCYIGLNKHLEEFANKEKYKLILRLMDYISTPEGQLALAGDTGGMYSSLNGMPPPEIPEIADIHSTLLHGRCTVFPVLKNAQSALRTGLAGMVAGTLTAADVGKMVDAQNTAPSAAAPPIVLGKAKDDFSLTETANFIADAMRKESGCDIALVLDNGKDGKTNGKGICEKIYSGDITETDLTQIMPDFRQGESGTLWKVTMTGADLLYTLEYAIPVENNSTGWFYYFSGLRMDYAPAAAPGTRIHHITDTDGNAIDPQRTYSIAIMDGSVPESCIISCEKTGILISDILKRAFAQGDIAPNRDGRFVVSAPNAA
ncbi:MAG: extracellular solute-binding protein [Ruthenibacterium sp.]